jgi:hypothetical protein
MKCPLKCLKRDTILFFLQRLKRQIQLWNWNISDCSIKKINTGK